MDPMVLTARGELLVPRERTVSGDPWDLLVPADLTEEPEPLDLLDPTALRERLVLTALMAYVVRRDLMDLEVLMAPGEILEPPVTTVSPDAEETPEVPAPVDHAVTTVQLDPMDARDPTESQELKDHWERTAGAVLPDLLVPTVSMDPKEALVLLDPPEHPDPEEELELQDPRETLEPLELKDLAVVMDVLELPVATAKPEQLAPEDQTVHLDVLELLDLLDVAIPELLVLREEVDLLVPLVLEERPELLVLRDEVVVAA